MNRAQNMAIRYGAAVMVHLLAPHWRGGFDYLRRLMQAIEVCAACCVWVDGHCVL